MSLLGSLETLTTGSGGYRGHCGEIDHRGRVFSGHALDETLRGEAAQIAGRASQTGYFGPLGIDAFTFVTEPRPADDERVVLRTGVECNARSTMGLVALGLLRRVFRARRAELGIEPGDRRAFLLAMVSKDEMGRLEEVAGRASPKLPGLRLVEPGISRAPRTPWLFFAEDLAQLRRAYRTERVAKVGP